MRNLLMLLALAGGWMMTTSALAEDKTPTATRLFEMRIYYPPEGKMEALLARFRDHTTKLFEKHGMKNIGYWVEKKDGKERLIYIVAHQNKEGADASWKAFRADPDWIKARDASEVNGKLVEKIETIWLTPTDFSTLK